MSRRKFVRRKVLIDRKLQIGLSGSIVVLLAVYFLLFCLIAIYSPYVFARSESETPDRVAAAARQVGEMFDLLIFPMALTFICLALHCILLMHRVAGPAYRFRKTLESMRNRDLTVHVRLRKGDYMRDLAEEFNALTATLREDLGEALLEAETVAEATRGLVSRSTGPAADQTADLARRAERVTAILGEYRLRDEV